MIERWERELEPGLWVAVANGVDDPRAPRGIVASFSFSRDSAVAHRERDIAHLTSGK